MSRIWAIIKREYIVRVRTKAFIIGTIAAPIVFIAMIVIPILLTGVEGDQVRRIAIIDLSGDMYAQLREALDGDKQGQRYIPEQTPVEKRDKRIINRTKPPDNGGYVLEQIPVKENNLDVVKEQLISKIINKQLDAYIIIGKHILEGEKPEYHSKHVSNFMELRLIEDTLTKIVVEKRLRKEGLDPENIDKITSRVDLKVIKLSGKGEEKEDRGETFFFSYILMLMLYTTVLLYGVAIMRSVIEDKSSRIVEVLASSVRPFDLMLGKLIGVGAVGLTQYLVWSILGIIVLLYGASIAMFFNPQAVMSTMPVIPVTHFIYFVIYFLLGYFLYSTMYIIVGSMVDNEQDAQNLQAPLIVFLVIPMLIAPMVLINPDSKISVILSLIPFFTPIVMFLRITVLTPSFWQIILSLVLSIVTILLMTWIAARVYKVGMLMYGKKISFPELIKWIKS
ncbi:MAG: hypothetical protein A2Y62_17900 [Candidatus Fischerbacteria bacterium RBG_13_37_8]|uniref:ABC-2 type transporter transmembrane domain-containing protein n=1 Tax=Candidatus Fischerbacteria bacterium RBG_13_37_8 TaxID=1817863 RepID=A0A1F5VN72_9BACT|nr:MAG: hypothetical protein A2Y62_17900 [Candidatus Fischerbacteria bacterium RBG_13_37_8]